MENLALNLELLQTPTPLLRAPVLRGVGTAFPERKYTQAEVRELLGIENKIVHRLLDARHIQTRHLYLPEPAPGETRIADETPGELIRKFERGALDIGLKAVQKAVADSRMLYEDMEFLICVTSSGFMVPGLSSLIARRLPVKQSLYRLDVVGMGCNAGMSALQTASALASTGKKGVLLCCEINSAIYARDESVRTGIVNSLFGDGAVAVVLGSNASDDPGMGSGAGQGRVRGVEILDFESHTLPEQWDAMKFDFDEAQGKWSFGLSKQIPFVVGDNLGVPVGKLLARHGLTNGMIRHWTIHTGGAAVIEGAKRSLGITEHDVRHTRSVLRDYGNISSGSFLVSHQRLLEEGGVEAHDLGIMAAMGPGATLEACLVRYVL